MTNRNHCESFVLRHYFVIRASSLLPPNSSPARTARHLYHAMPLTKSCHPESGPPWRPRGTSLSELASRKRSANAPQRGRSHPFGIKETRLLLYVARTRVWRLCFSNTEISSIPKADIFSASLSNS